MRMVTCSALYNCVEDKIGKLFGAYGRFVSRHPWKIIVIGIILNGLLGLGMVRLNYVIDIERVYTPIGSQASKDGDELKSLFPDLSGSNFIQYQMPDLGKQAEVIVKPKGGDILNANFLGNLTKLYTFLLSITTTDKNGKTILTTDVCARSFNSCSIYGDIFIDNEFKQSATVFKNVSFPFFPHSHRGNVYIKHIVGGANEAGGQLQAASMLRMCVNLRTDSDYYVDSSKRWQDKFLEQIEQFSNVEFAIRYTHGDSLSEELDDNVTGDIALFSVTFTILITYACIATLTARCDVVGQSSNLAFGGVIAAGLAVVSSFGIGSACGLDFVSIVGVVPFLILGIGVDDMFLLVSGITSASYKDSVEDRVAETMRTSGVSITITSLTDLLAFAAGASSVFLSVRNFCIYAGIAVIFCYINQATIFVSCIVLNDKRMADNRHFATCRRIYPLPDYDDKGETQVYESMDDIPQGNGTQTDSRRSCRTICCYGRKPQTRKEAESFLDKVPRFLIPKIVQTLPAKIVILLIFAIYLGISIWGVTEMKQGLELKNLVSESSYYYKYREWLDQNFPESTPISLVFDEQMTYTNLNTQQNIEQLLTGIKQENTIVPASEINWLKSYMSTAFYVNTSESAFVSGLQKFLAIPTSTRFQNDVVIKSNVIIASRMHFTSTSIKDSQEQGHFMLRMREIANASPLSVFAFSPAFLFYEQYVIILSQTLQTLGIAVGMVFFVTSIFMPHPILLIFITVTVASITVGIFGFLPFTGLTLSAITMIHIIMSIGFSVDFAAHICHGYMISPGKDRHERMMEGLSRSGAPIFHGAISSILGVIMLAAAKSYIFYSFFQVMSLVIFFGITHALFLLPVVLSFIGPSPSVSTSDPSFTNGGRQSRVSNKSRF